MFKRDHSKGKNPLRVKIAKRGHSIRSASEFLRLNPAELCHRLQEHDEPGELERMIESLPSRTKNLKKAAS